MSSKPGSYGNRIGAHASAQYGDAKSAIPSSFKKIASGAGWIDQELVTVRRMCKEGYHYDEIAAAIGKSYLVTKGIIARNHITYRGVRKKLPPGGMFEKLNHDWWPKAIAMYQQGASLEEISIAVKRGKNTVAFVVDTSWHTEAIYLYQQRHWTPRAIARKLHIPLMHIERVVDEVGLPTPRDYDREPDT